MYRPFLRDIEVILFVVVLGVRNICILLLLQSIQLIILFLILDWIMILNIRRIQLHRLRSNLIINGIQLRMLMEHGMSQQLMLNLNLLRKKEFLVAQMMEVPKLLDGVQKHSKAEDHHWNMTKLVHFISE